MDIEKLLRDDLWEAIKKHYVVKDFSESVRDAFYFTADFIRDLGGIDDKDGTKLMDTAFLGSSPAILVNNNESTTEKDIQQGIGFAFKGLILANRNPFSHEKPSYTEEEAIAVILYINYLLNRIDLSTGIKRIRDVMILLRDPDFTSSEEFAELLLKKIPSKKRYDLLLDLYRQRKDLPEGTLHAFIHKLFNALSKQQKNSFINAVSNDLILCKDDDSLKLYLHYFFDITYGSIDELSQLRIEDLIEKSLKKGELTSYYDFGEELFCSNREGALSVYASEILKQLKNYGKMLSIIHRKLFVSSESEHFIFQYFKGYIFSVDYTPDDYVIQKVRERLLSFDKKYCDALTFEMDILESSIWKQAVKKEYELCVNKMVELGYYKQ